MHFEIVCTPADLAMGIHPASLPGGTTKPNPAPPEDDMPTAEEIAEALRPIVAEEVGKAIGWTRAVAENPERADTDPQSQRLADRAAHLNPERKG